VIPLFGTGLWNNGGTVNVVGQATTDIWDGTSDSRPNANVYRGPDWQDYNKAFILLHDMMLQIVPLGLSALGAVPTSDPSEAGQLYTDSGSLKVSAG